MGVTKDIFSGLSNTDFEMIALDLFKEQYRDIEIYRKYCDMIGNTKAESLEEIPFLPISFFKSHKVLSNNGSYEKLFLSSGTSKQKRSQHYVKSLKLYEQSFMNGFEQFYGKVSDYCILAMLPSYLENGDSSLIYMVDSLMKKARNDSQYIKANESAAVLIENQKKKSKVLIIGVTYALLEFGERFPIDLSGHIVMETGGMKGKSKELIRQEVHSILKKAFNLKQIHSEYGMTELLSQAYSRAEGLFESPDWIRVFIRSSSDPLELDNKSSSGGINIIDLANKNSCAFIATQDLGRISPDGKFEVLGRFDSSDIRGCNLLSF